MTTIFAIFLVAALSAPGELPTTTSEIPPLSIEAEAALTELLTPAPTYRGLQGPCTITVTCAVCECGTFRLTCSGERFCVGGGGVNCDDRFTRCLSCATYCSM